MNRVHFIPHHIMACCVLHNICLMKQDDLNIDLNEEVYDAITADEIIPSAANAHNAKRDLICENLPMRYV